jgi:UDP-glucose 4-epimerase
LSILVTGGAGYIGAATVQSLLDQGDEVVVLDNLFRGHREAVPKNVSFYQGNIGDRKLVARITSEHRIEACIHFAALAYVGESVNEPARYFENNLTQGIALFEGLRESGVNQIVFSSSCATYGEPESIPISEQHPQHPTNPYGWSKFCVERVLESYDQAYGFRFVSLRYFNAAGATKVSGEHHDPETHLIPNVLAAAIGKKSHVSVFGGDYPTSDGTAVRDYIHISDLATAHILALRYLANGGKSEHINLGSGQGYTVLQVIEMAKRITGRDIVVKIEPPRPGDPSHLVAKAEKAAKVLGWQAAYPDLDAIIASAWEWMKSHPGGYTR